MFFLGTLLFFSVIPLLPRSTLFPYTTLFRSLLHQPGAARAGGGVPARHRGGPDRPDGVQDRKSTRLNSSHEWISYAVFCLKKKRPASKEAWMTTVGVGRDERIDGIGDNNAGP